MKQGTGPGGCVLQKSGFSIQGRPSSLSPSSMWVLPTSHPPDPLGFVPALISTVIHWHHSWHTWCFTVSFCWDHLFLRGLPKPKCLLKTKHELSLLQLPFPSFNTSPSDMLEKQTKPELYLKKITEEHKAAASHQYSSSRDKRWHKQKCDKPSKNSRKSASLSSWGLWCWISISKVKKLAVRRIIIRSLVSSTSVQYWAKLRFVMLYF